MFVYDHKQDVLLMTEDHDGKLKVRTHHAWSPVPVAGEQIAIENIYGESTLHTVTSASGSIIFTDTNYADFTLPFPHIVKHIRLPQIELYCGYLAAEEYPNDLPLTLVAAFTPENAPGNYVQFDVSEYLRSIFTIPPPVEGIDFNMFNRFRLRFDGVYKTSYMVLNSSIKTTELNSRYVDTLAPLHSHVPPVVFGCGNTLISYLTANVVLNKTVTDTADISGFGRYNPDFSNDFNIV